MLQLECTSAYQDETQVVQQLQNILTAPDVLESDSMVNAQVA
ncbi:hypothetical protein QUA20_30535 [Microcoleus sp. Pol7_A1]